MVLLLLPQLQSINPPPRNKKAAVLTANKHRYELLIIVDDLGITHVSLLVMDGDGITSLVSHTTYSLPVQP